MSLHFLTIVPPMNQRLARSLAIISCLWLGPMIALHAGEPPLHQPGAPVLYWSAEPVLPGEVAMLQGAGFDAVSRIELACAGKTVVVPVLDASERSLRFVLPKEWAPGVTECRVVTGKGSLKHTLNAPHDANRPDTMDMCTQTHNYIMDPNNAPKASIYSVN